MLKFYEALCGLQNNKINTLTHHFSFDPDTLCAVGREDILLPFSQREYGGTRKLTNLPKSTHLGEKDQPADQNCQSSVLSSLFTDRVRWKLIHDSLMIEGTQIISLDYFSKLKIRVN